MQPEEFFAGNADGLAIFESVHSILQAIGPVEVRVTKSQVAFRRKRGFAYLWLPGRYLAKAQDDVVLSIALGRHEASTRFKQVVRVSPRHWMHHLVVRGPGEVDAEVSSWLREAADRAG